MTRKLAPILIAAGALLVPATAAAKEISQVAVCGTGKQCVTYDKGDVKDLHVFVDSGANGETEPPAGPATYYHVTFTVDTRAEGGGRDSWTIAYVPSAGLMRGRDGSRYIWTKPAARQKRALDRAVQGLPAFAAARLKGLDSKPLAARVDETFVPAARSASSPPPSAPADEGAPWGWILAALSAAGLAAGAAVRALRRRSASSAEASPAAAR